MQRYFRSFNFSPVPFAIVRHLHRTLRNRLENLEIFSTHSCTAVQSIFAFGILHVHVAAPLNQQSHNIIRTYNPKATWQFAQDHAFNKTPEFAHTSVHRKRAWPCLAARISNELPSESSRSTLAPSSSSRDRTLHFRCCTANRTLLLAEESIAYPGFPSIWNGKAKEMTDVRRFSGPMPRVISCHYPANQWPICTCRVVTVGCCWRSVCVSYIWKNVARWENWWLWAIIEYNNSSGSSMDLKFDIERKKHKHR